MPLLAALLCTLAALMPVPAAATTVQACDKAAERAARESGVPRAVLLSITRTETGRHRDGRLAPWPWAVNMEGEGRWFDTRSGARSYAERRRRAGARNFDIGCFQINYRWHGDAFESIDQMLDPLENARYAAAFLARLHEELGDWSLAAGAYHSRTSVLARKYRKRFDEILETVSAGTSPVGANHTATHRRQGGYPLLQKDGGPSGRNGSLVPLAIGARAVIPLFGGS